MVDKNIKSISNSTKMKLICKQFGNSCHNLASDTQTYSDIYFIKVLNKAFNKLPISGKNFINCFYFFQNTYENYFEHLSKKDIKKLDDKYTSLFINYVEEIYGIYN